MFTIKLMKMEAEKTTQCVMSCARYEVLHNPGVITISVYSAASDESAIDFKIDRESHFNVAFIENMAGKTIDKLGPIT